MKHLSIGLYLFLVTQSVFSQDLNNYKNTISIDAISALAALMGSYDRYDLFEIGYTRSMEEIDFRVKFNFNVNDQDEDRILASKFIDEEEQFRFTSNFRSSRNLLLSLGIAKIIKKGKVNYYVGLDAFSGVDIGYANSFITDENDDLNGRFLGDLKSTSYNLGITPVLGTKTRLHGRISLALEFGLPIRFDIGTISYFDEVEVQREVSVDGYHFGFDQLLNDIRISYNF